MMRYSCWFLVSLLLILANLIPTRNRIRAAPHQQDGTATLQLINHSTHTICAVYVTASTETAWGENRLEKEVLEPEETIDVTLVEGTYKLLLVDCHRVVLLLQYKIEITHRKTLTLTDEAVVEQCDKLHQVGVQAYSRANYATALEFFQAALGCLHTVGDRTSEAAILNNIGLMYDNQGRYAEALAQYEASLVITREVGDRAGEGTTRNNIGGVYHAQGRYVEALTNYKAAQVILREIGDRAGEGRALNNIGGVYDNQGRYAEALDSYQQALTIWRAVGDRAGEATTLNNIAGVHTHQGQYEEVLAQYEAVLIIRREVGDRAGEATTLHNIGRVYYGQGRYVEALVNYTAALLVEREIGDRAGEGTTLNGIGQIYDNQGRDAEALAHYETALAISREVGDRAGEGITLNNIGAMYQTQGRYADALVNYEAALVIMSEVGNRIMQGTILNNIGGVYVNQGRYAEALVNYEVALKIAVDVGNRPGEWTTLNNIGVVYGHQGRYAEALMNYEAALEITRDMDDHIGEGTTLNNIGVVYHTQGRYTDALASYETALVILREVGNRAAEGTMLNNIGGVYDSQGRYAEALESYQQALAIQREVSDRAGEAATLNNIGLVYNNQRRYAEALASYEAALVIVHEVGDRADEGRALTNIGEVYEEQAQYTNALTSYQQAIAVFESVRAGAGSETGRSGFIAQYTGVYDRIIRLQLKQNKATDAFLTSERGRARAFLDSLATSKVELFDNAVADLLARENEAYTVRQSSQDALARAKALNPPNSELVADLEEQLAASEAAYAAALAAIQDRQGQLADLVPGRNNRVLALATAQQQLDVQTTLVSYWMLDDKTVAFILTANAFTSVELPDATTDQITVALQNLYQWRNHENPHPLPLRNLYRWLVEPLAEHLQTSHVAIIPHQLLHYVPFAALTDGQSYFGQQYTLSLLPSASVLPFLNENARNGQSPGNLTAVIFGNPKTELTPLSYAEAEAQAVADLIGATVYTGTQASELQLRAVVSSTNILHLAAHGDYNLANPLYSAIALAADDEQDGLLETHEIFGLPLRGNDLVVLSACQTSLNELKESSAVAVSRGDEIVGLTRAFFFAGAPTVISSLWSVNDAATEALMVAFYKHWLKKG